MIKDNEALDALLDSLRRILDSLPPSARKDIAEVILSNLWMRGYQIVPRQENVNERTPRAHPR